MSSILRALKKLESHRGEQEKVQSLSSTVYLKKGKSAGNAAHWKSPRAVLLLAVVIGVMGTGYLVFNYGGNGSDTTPSPDLIKEGERTSTGFLKDSARKPITIPPAKETPLPSVEEGIFSKDRPAPDVGRKTATVSAEPDIEKPAMPAVSERKSDPGGLLSVVDQEESTQPSTSAVESEEVYPWEHRPVPVTSPKIEASRREEERIEPLTDSNLKLMAIAWSDDPKSRIAVINDWIVREGDVVEGLTVYRINEDDVVFRKGGDLQKLLFRLQ